MEHPREDEASLVSNTEGGRASSIIGTEKILDTPQGHRTHDGRFDVDSSIVSQLPFASMQNQFQPEHEHHSSVEVFHVQLRAEKQQEIIHQYQARAFGMVPNPTELVRPQMEMRGRQQAASDIASLPSGQVESTAYSETTFASRLPFPVMNTADIPAPIIPLAQSVPQAQASTVFGNLKTSESQSRAEEAIRNMVQTSTLKSSTSTGSFSTFKAKETSQKPALLNLLGAQRRNSQGQPVEAQLSPGWRQGLSQPGRYAETAVQLQNRFTATRPAILTGQFDQMPTISSAAQDSMQNCQSIESNMMIYGNRLNAFPASQSSDAQVYIPPSVTQETRLVPGRFRLTSLKGAQSSARQQHRKFSRPLGSAQKVSLTAPSRPHGNQRMGPPVTPNAKRIERDASGPSGQTTSSQTHGLQAPSELATMGPEKSEPDTRVGDSQYNKAQAPSGMANTLHSLPDLSAVVNANGSVLQQPQNANQRPDGYIVMPGQYTPIPALLPYPVSSPTSQVEQDSSNMSQSQGSHEYKTRITIAISGSPASGKSTLVYLLAAIFEGATIPDTGFAGAQTMYPPFNGRVKENPNRKGPITKVFVIDQNSCIKPVAQWPVTEWSELYPYSPAMDVMNPHIGAARVLANERGSRSYERYWEAAYEASIGVDPHHVSNSSSRHFPSLVAPTPIRIPKQGPIMDCRGAVDWVKFGKAINDGMRGHKNKEGILETEEGRDKIEAYLSQTNPKTGIPLVDSKKLEPLRKRIREWIREETAQNDRIGFPGRSVVDGSLRQMLILDGSLLFLQTHPGKGAGGEKLMKACDVNLFLPTLEAEAIQRRFSQEEYMDPPRGTRRPEHSWMFEGYFSEVAWKEYKSEHEWLFENGDETSRIIKTTPAAYHRRIHVRSFYTANLEEKGHKYEGKRWADETLDWAVRMILFQLSVEEGFGRQAFFAKMNEAAAGEATANGPGREGASGMAEGEAVDDVMQ